MWNVNNLFGGIEKYLEPHMEIHGENQFHGIPSFIHYKQAGIAKQSLLHQEIVLDQQVPHMHSLR